jgi:hypothetical protein
MDSTNKYSIGTEETSDEEHMNGGGLYFSQNGGTNTDNLLLKAGLEKNSSVVEFMINNNMITNVSTKDKTGKNIIHYIANDYNLYNDKQLIDKLMFLNNSNLALNQKDNNGNTPLIISVKNEHNNLADTLINLGANKKIKNNDGYWVNSLQSEEENNTNNFIENLTGGNRDIILGNRKSLFNESGITGRRIYKSKKRYTEESMELTRLMNNQATEIHDRVKTKIKELYKDMSDEDIKFLKATLYKMIKQKNPTLGNLDRAVEMEKNTNKDEIDKLLKSKLYEDTKKGVIEHYKKKKEDFKKNQSNDKKTTAKKTTAKKTTAKKTTAKKKTTKKKKGGGINYSDTSESLF